MSQFQGALSILFDRLTWPTGMVRERACTSIGALLADPTYRDAVTASLGDWARDVNLESMAVFPLLIASSAANQGWAVPHEVAYHWSTCFPSLVGMVIMTEVYPHEPIDPRAFLSHSGRCPPDHEVSDFFTRYVKTFIPPIYVFWAEQIVKREGIEFTRQWHFEWTEVLNRAGIAAGTGPIDFRGMADRDHYMAIDFKMSEAFRSGYLRALAWAVSERRLSLANAVFFAAQCCPIDLELWKLIPTRKPSWWPTCSVPAGQIDTSCAQIWDQVEQLWSLAQADHETVIGVAIGQVCSGESIYDLEIYGCLQQSQGPEEPDLAELTEWFTERPELHFQNTSPLRFGGTIIGRELDEESEQAADWLILPLASSGYIHTVPRWQWWRGIRKIWLPSVSLIGGSAEVNVLNDEIQIVEDGETVARWTDWTDGVKETVTANAMPSTGQQLLLHRRHMDTVLPGWNDSYCWICRITSYHRQHGLGPFSVFSEARQFGASRIVRV